MASSEATDMEASSSTEAAGRPVGSLGLLAAILLLFSGRVSGAETVVTLGFDDGRASQYQAREILRSRGVKATFYVNSAGLGWSNYLTVAQLQALASDGHEIAGHTLDHPHLTQVSPEEARRQICQDREALIAMGFQVTSFAYPYGEYNAALEAMVAECGYTSGRTVGGLSCSACPAAERIPPVDAYATRTPESVKVDTTLARMQNWVLAAEAAGGGWVQLIIHDVCVDCGNDVYSVSRDTLAALLDWLAPRASRGTVVKTAAEVMGAAPPTADDQTPPETSIACSPRGCSEWSNTPVTVTLSAVDDSSGVAEIRFTTDGTDPGGAGAKSCSGDLCSFTVSATTVVKYRAEDLAGNVEATGSQTIRVDTQAPQVAITSPTGLAVVSGAVTVRASASDNVGVAQVSFYADGRLIGIATTAPYQVQWRTSGIIGTHTLHAEAEDLAGNVTESAPVNVLVVGLLSLSLGL